MTATPQLTVAEFRLLARLADRPTQAFTLAANTLSFREEQVRRRELTAPFVALARAHGLAAEYVVRHPQPSPDRWCRSLDEFASNIDRWLRSGRGQLRKDPMWIHCDGNVVSWKFIPPSRFDAKASA